MKYIAYIFTVGDSFVSKAIRLQTWGDVNHTAFEFVDDSLTVQIQHPVVIGIPRQQLINKSRLAYRFVFGVSDELYDKALEFAKAEMIGKAYDKVSVARFLVPLRRVLGWLKPAVREANSTWFCAEGAEVLGRKCEKGLVRQIKEPARVSPQDQYESRLLELCAIYEEYQQGSLLYSGPYTD